MSKVTNCAFCGKQITKGFLSGDATELTLSLDVAITCCEECEKKYSNELYYDHERFAKKIYNYQKKAKVKLTDRQIAHYFLKYTNDINKHNEKMAFEATPEFYAFYNYDEKGRFSVEEFQLGFRTRDIKIYDMALSKMENVTAIDNVFDKNDITKIAYRRKRLGDICGLFSAAYTNGIAQVYRPAAGTSFQYDNLIFWQAASAAHNFYAFYPYSLYGSVTSATAPYITYTQPTANDATMVDLMTAYTSTAKCNLVELTFNHRLWALDVVITNGQTEGIDPDDQVTNAPTLTIKSVSVTVENFPTGAQIYLNKDHSPGLVLNTATNKYTYTINPKATNGDVLANSGETATATYGSLLFLPITAGTFKYSLEITYLDSRGVESTFSTGTAKTINKAFEAGKRYKFTVNKTNDTFVIGTLTPTDWTDQDVNHEFN